MWIWRCGPPEIATAPLGPRNDKSGAFTIVTATGTSRSCGAGRVHRFEFTENDSLVFGRETSGLPPEVIGLSPHHVRIPIKGEVRSINLSTAAGIVLFQALVSAGLVGE